MGENGPDLHKKSARWHGRIPITSALVISMGVLILVTVSVVLGIGVWTAQKNTVNLLAQSADQAVTSASDKVVTYLKPAEFQAKFIAEWITRGKITPDNRSDFANILIAALAAAPQIEALLFINTDLKSIGAGRENDRIGIKNFDYSNDPYIIKGMKDVSIQAGWGPPIWRKRNNKTYLNYATPVIIKGKFIGAMVSVVSINELSRFVSQSGLIANGQQFLLYGKNHVMAHWLLESDFANRSSKHPLPHLPQFSDPVLSSIWQTKGRYNLDLPLPKGTKGHVLRIFNKEYVFLFQNLEGFGPQPIYVGAYFLSTDVNEEMQRLIYSLIAGLVALAISILIAVLIGHQIARPIVRFSAVANRVRNLDIAKVGYLPNSVFRELNDQSTSFNAMLRALRWFELYVPKKIVESLIRQNTQVGDDISSTQEITVMFTDIVGFTSTSENMTAREVATFVNEHFTLVAECIEKEEGIVDKFIGDSVMAFWGAPDTQSNNADRACRAALSIRKNICKDNLKRKSQGKPPIHLRIGIHTGPAIVGNIGSTGRLNYTVIGDTVNIGQRLEQLGKELVSPGTEVSCLISGQTAHKLKGDFTLTSAGKVKLKGHTETIEVFKLI